MPRSEKQQAVMRVHWLMRALEMAPDPLLLPEAARKPLGDLLAWYNGRTRREVFEHDCDLRIHAAPNDRVKAMHQVRKSRAAQLVAANPQLGAGGLSRG